MREVIIVPVTVNVLVPAFGLVIVNARLVVPFSGIVEGLKVLLIDGGAAATVRFAVAEFPVPPLVEVTAPVLFV